MRVAVVGAGIAGLACARSLVAAGHAVTVFERAAVPGGRVATMRTEIGGFDHGAQYLTARDAAFSAEVARWRTAGVIAPWPVVAHRIEAAAAPAPPPAPSRDGHTQRWVGVPGMAAIASHLADGLDIRCGASITALEAAAPDARARGWTLRQRTGDGEPAVVDETFDAVAVALPPEPAAQLLPAAPTLARRAAAARIEPCWALLLGFAEPLPTDATRVGDAAFVAGGRLAWIARESSKPQRRIGERWTVHAQSAWSVEHFDDDPEDVKAKLLRAFHDATATIEQPVYATAHRWRYALARSSLDCGCLWDADRRIGACGDWCRGFRVEDAWLSGVALAAAVGVG